MAGVPTKFIVAELVFDRLRQAGGDEKTILDDPAALPFAFLGASGSALGDLMAASPLPADAGLLSPYFRVWLPVLQLLAGSPTASPPTNGLYADIRQLDATLTKLQGIVASKDKFALIGMKDELNALKGVITDVQTVMAGLSGLRLTIGKAIFNSGPVPKVSPSSAWPVRQTLQQSHTGTFLAALRDRAASSNDNRLKAYSIGATVAYAVELVGNPFINSAVGSTYRNHWWRQRWISCYVDAWVHGYYRAGGADKVFFKSSRIPKPLYTDWPNVCNGKLHKQIELPGLHTDDLINAVRNGTALPNTLPADFVAYWQGAYQDTYGQPTAGGPVSDAGLQTAFAMLWLILWIQTSGEFLPCVPPDQINYPDNCGARPPWVAVDGSVATGGGVTAPPAASKNTKPSVGEVISGIVLAVLGVLQLLTGNVAGGIIEIAAAVALIADGETDPDWDALRCYVGWTFAFFYNMTNAMHELLKWSALGFPYTEDLAHNEIAFQQAGLVTPPDAALNTARSKPRSSNFPAAKWTGPATQTSNWANPPTEPLEPPSEWAYLDGSLWPDHFVDGRQGFAPNPPNPTPPPQQLNPLVSLPGQPPLVRDPAAFQDRQARLGTSENIGQPFGNAVDVSLELILNTQTTELLNWDLDADRGLGFPTWLGDAAGKLDPEP